MSTFGNVTGYKISIQSPAAFLHSNRERNQENNSIHNSLKKKKKKQNSKPMYKLNRGGERSI
jgi:hypothetical protein